ncbi:MAG: hypothetical protein JNG85_14770 [Spirochaetaceae bacterium]|nr:hypothetical protein [Spirochaetaceae bacterium]
MIQFYFLSILLNVVGGYALAIDATHRSSPAVDGLRAFLRDPTVRLVIGILTIVTGAFKLLAVVRGDIPVVGDFVPAVAGLAVGATILLELYREPSGDHPFGAPTAEDAAVKDKAKAKDGNAATTEAAANPAPRGPGRIERFLLEKKAVVGIAGVLAGLVHFLFPVVLFL